MLVSNPVQFPAGCDRLGSESGTFPATSPDGPATPADQRDTEVHGSAIDQAYAAHRVRLGRTNGLGWVIVAARIGRQLGIHDDAFLNEDGSRIRALWKSVRGRRMKGGRARRHEGDARSARRSRGE
ncbi:hypothetical protein C3B61_01385 [Cryobacterium zongtaii]|uniref:Uncharacterized protein n=1 Tax=Cryobacterium zongtaii TaxID=1259217 RepID=A0A2S3ZMZ9_9MICO|nr:hypothetical protein C3B60_05695 [Cryobacterium zongtaii]POH70294.1 hypothetical protein C3B61_01385 [Cryobacterium zongtaii]